MLKSHIVYVYGLADGVLDTRKPPQMQKESFIQARAFGPDGVEWLRSSALIPRMA